MWILLGVLVGVYCIDLWLSILNYQHRKQPIPLNVQDVYDEKRYQEWLEYSMQLFKDQLIKKTISLLLLVIFLASGFLVFLANWTEGLNVSSTVSLLLYLFIYYLITFIIGIVFKYREKFVIEQKFGLNNSTLKIFVMDRVKEFVLTTVFGGGLLALVFLFYVRFQEMFILYTYIVAIVLMLVVNMIYTKVLVPIFNKLTPLEDGELKDAIVDFSKQVGYEIKSIRVMNASKRSTKLNAFFSGFGRFKKIVLFDTLVAKMNTRQIVSVLAHEVGHGKHKDVIKGMISSIFTFAIFLVALLFVIESNWLATSFGFNDRNFGFGLIAFMVLIQPLGLLVSLLMNSLSRRREYAADNYAANNGYELELIESLKILSKENYGNLTPHPYYVLMHYSHPPVTDRILAINKNHGTK